MASAEVPVRQLRFLRGPNLYAYMPVLFAVVEIGVYDERGSDSFPGFTERITSWLPGLATHECSLNRPGGFVERLRRGTYLPHIAEHVAIELQNLCGFPVTFGRARGTGERGVYSVVVEYKEEEPARAAFDLALRLTLAALNDEPFAIADELAVLRRIADDHRLGPSTQAIVNAARHRRIPVLRLSTTSSLVQLGWGIHQKRIQAAETSNTSAIAVDLCQSKPMTNRVLRAVGVPVPNGRVVESAAEAWSAALEIGLPVVVKPTDGNQGKGVSTKLTSEEAVRSAFEIARAFGDGVLVEEHVRGDDYRLLVVGGKLIAAARREPARVNGDGARTIVELVGDANADARRGAGHGSALSRIVIDEAARLVLAEQGFAAESVPAAGRIVRLRQNANLSTGGTATDVTDDVHPRNAQLAELAAEIIGLDVAGIDVVCEDIRRPIAEQRGAIVEVNAAPGLRMHLHPTAGQPRDVGAPIVEMLYPRPQADDRSAGGASGRIPIVAVTGTNGKTTVTRLIGHVYETARQVVGMTTTEGIYIGGEQVSKGDCAGPQSARVVLLHPKVEVAVLETARGGILREGLAFDECHVGVVTNLSGDHLGADGIGSVEELARVKQVVVEAVGRNGAAVLNADDRLVAEMAAACEGRVVYFSETADNPIVSAHLKSGGQAVFAERGAIVLATGDSRVELIDLARTAWTLGGKVGFLVQNALAAAAAAWAGGLNPALIARALATFQMDAALNPGRFNVVTIKGVEVIFDYGHNAAAMQGLGQAVEILGRRPTHMLIGLPGDRRDEDLLATVDATRSFVDAYIVQDQANRRGRAAREVYELVRGRAAGAPCEYVPSEREGIARLWQRAKPGDRLILIVDDAESALTLLRQYAGPPVNEDGACQPVLQRRAA